MGIDQLSIAGQRHRHRVDREVAAGEVGGQRRRANLGERARVSVRLGCALPPGRPRGRRPARPLCRSARAHRTSPPSRRASSATSPSTATSMSARRGQAADRARRRRPDMRRSPSRPRAGARSREAPPGAPRVARARSWRWGATSRLFMGPSDPFPTMTAFADGSPARHLALVERPAPARRGRRRCRGRGRRGDRRLPDHQAPGGRLQSRRRLSQAEAGSDQDGRLAAVRARPPAHPLPAGKGPGPALRLLAVELPGGQAARVPADRGQGQDLLHGQGRDVLRAQHGHRARSSGSGRSGR